MRIGIITPGFSKNEEDWCIPSLLTFVRELAAHSQVTVFALHYPPHPEYYKVFGADVFALGGDHAKSVKRLLLFIRTLGLIWKEHRRKPFNVLHAMWGGEPGLVAGIAGRLLGIPTVLTLGGGELAGIREIHYGLQLRSLSRSAVSLSLRFADRITVGSSYMLGLLRRFLKGQEKALLLPFGVDSRLFRPSTNHVDRSVRKILSVGSLTPVKDHRTLLRALEKVTRVLPQVHLSIVGSGELDTELRNLAKELAIFKLMNFPGQIPHHELPKYYSKADVVVLPSLHEGQGMVALEALACGVPVIGTRVGILVDLPRDVCTTVDVGEIDALAGVLIHLLQDGKRGDDTARQARRVVEERYTMERTVETFLGLYATRAERRNANLVEDVS